MIGDRQIDGPTFIRLAVAVCLILFLSPLISNGQTNAVDPNPGARQKAEAGNATGVISGLVVNDEGQPLADAQVTITSARGISVYALGRAATTQPDGRFSFANLRPGVYRLRAESPGYTRADMDDPRDLQFTYRPGSNVTLRMVKGGVITGTVTDAFGSPLVEIPIRALRIRDAQGRRPEVATAMRNHVTDDRGVYRIYGLPAGTYLVAAGSIAGLGDYAFLESVAQFSPVFYPSAPIETAAEVVVNTGQEAGGIDIRIRGDAGHIVSGSIAGATKAADGKNYGVSVVLRSKSNGADLSNAMVVERNGKMAFAFSAVPDGEYDLAAESMQQDGGAKAVPVRVIVKGADVGGVQLVLQRYGSIGGRVVLESNKALTDKPACAIVARRVQSEEISLQPRRNASSKETRYDRGINQAATAPDAEGNFTALGLVPGAYWLQSDPGDEGMYLRSMTTTSTGGKPVDAARTGLNLGTGQDLRGVTLTFSDGAAGLKGRIAARDPGPPLPNRTLLHLVPSEPESADEVFRYREVEVGSDGIFSFANLAPGKYWVYGQVLPVSDIRETFRRPVVWEAAARVKLRKSAEAANQILELKPCQRISDQVIRLSK